MTDFALDIGQAGVIALDYGVIILGGGVVGGGDRVINGSVKVIALGSCMVGGGGRVITFGSCMVGGGLPYSFSLGIFAGHFGGGAGILRSRTIYLGGGAEGFCILPRSFGGGAGILRGNTKILGLNPRRFGNCAGILRGCTIYLGGGPEGFCILPRSFGGGAGILRGNTEILGLNPRRFGDCYGRFSRKGIIGCSLASRKDLVHYGSIYLFHIDADFHRVSSDRALRIGVALKGKSESVISGLNAIHNKAYHYPMITEIKLLGCGVGGIEDMVILTINGKGAMPGKGFLFHRIHTHLLNLNGIPSDGYAAIRKREFQVHITSNAFCSNFNSWHNIINK